VGKIAEIEKMQKDQPGQIKITIEGFGTMTAVREKDKDTYGGKEVFMPVGYRQNIQLSRKVNVPAKAKSKTRSKGLITANVEIGSGNLIVKMGTLKYPVKIDVYLEPSGSLPVTDIKEDSIRLTSVNGFDLPKPIGPSDEKIKVADHNRNNIQELNYKFEGWEVIQYLPEGSSTVNFSASAKDGRPIEATAKVTIEYQ
jgi:hypothetical protein